MRRRPACSFTVAIVPVGIPGNVWPDLPASFKPMLMLGSTIAMSLHAYLGQRRKRRAGHTAAASSSITQSWDVPARHRARATHRCVLDIERSIDGMPPPATPGHSPAAGGTHCSVPSRTGCRDQDVKARRCCRGHGLHAQAAGDLTRFLADGRICLTSNGAERACAVSPLDASHGCSPVPIVADSAPPPCIRWSWPPSSTTSIHRLGLLTCSPGSATIPLHACISCFPGTGAPSLPSQPELTTPRQRLLIDTVTPPCVARRRCRVKPRL